jgi:hypothetical protein
MQRVDYFINNKSVTPINHKELAIELNFDRDSPDAKLSTNKWRFTDENADEINKHFNDGLNNGVGIFEGIPFDIVVSDGNNSVKFEQYLNLVDDDTVISCEEVECGSEEKGKIEWLNTIADSFTFEYLHEITGFLPDTKFIAVPYVINSVPNYKDALIASIATIFIAEQIKKATAELAGLVSAAANPFSAPSEALRAAFLILYLITLIISLVKLIKDILDLLIQPVKYHSGMYVKDLINSACQYLGLTFQSTLLAPNWDKLFILPRKLENPPDPKDNRILGFLKFDKTKQVGYYEGTFGDLLRALKSAFNAKIIMQNGKLIFERKDFNTSGAIYKIPDLYSPTFGTNASEIKSNLLIEFLVDVNDKNTIQNYKGTSYQVQQTPIKVTNKDMVLIQNYENVTIPFALARAKTSLTLPEKIVDVFLTGVSGIMNGLIKVVNGMISVVNGIAKALNSIKKVLNLIGIKVNIKLNPIKKIQAINFGQIINDRIGMMVLENDAVMVQKMMLIDVGGTNRGNKLNANNQTQLAAKYLYDNYHFINSFAPSAALPNANQWIRKRIENAPFCFDDYLLVKNGNKIIAPDGSIAKIESLKWNIWDQKADIEYRINKLYTNNLKLTTSEPKGY